LLVYWARIVAQSCVIYCEPYVHRLRPAATHVAVAQLVLVLHVVGSNVGDIHRDQTRESATGADSVHTCLVEGSIIIQE